jgi:outer membrane immunogenic protein
MKKIILAAIAAAALNSTAMAADLGPYTKAPAPAPIYNWTGLYLGVNGGYGWGSSSDVLFNNLDMTGGFFGGQVGYNWQVGNFVFGAEVDAHWANISEQAGIPAFATAETNIDFFGSARLRAGFAVQQALIYLTGGVAIANNEITLSAPVILIPAFSDSQTHVGWTVGAGVEYAFAPAWTAKLEYRYTNYGSETYFNNTFATGDVDVSTIHFGVNYRFR